MYTILYVDDEPDLLVLGREFLERSPDFRVVTISMAREALDSAEIGNCDAIVSDYHMEDMDGITFLKEVRERFGDIPFILFTGRGREAVVIDAINNGVDFYIQKGGDAKAQFAELEHKIRQAIARRKAEHSLVESENRLTDIINFLPDATFAIDREGRVIAWNHAIEEMTGVPAAVMLGKGNHEYSVPFYGDRRLALIDMVSGPDDILAQYYTHISRDRGILTGETVIARPDGRPRTLMATARALYDRQGAVAGAIESLRDISGIRSAEEALRASEEKYRLVVENSQDAIYIHRSDRLLFTNQRASELTGYAHDELMQIHLWDLVHPDDRASLIDRAKRRFAGEAVPSGFAARLVTKDGRETPCEFFVDLVMCQGAPAILGIARDITVRKEAEDTLRASEVRFRELTELLPQIIFETDKDLRITYVNRCARTFTGVTPEDLARGYSAFDFIAPKDHRRAQESIGKIIRGETIMHEEYGAIRRDGTPIAVMIYAAPILHEGAFAGLRGVVVDVSERRRVEDALRESEAEFRDFFNNTGDAIVIHDLQGRFLEVNDEICRRLGYSREELLAMSPRDIDEPEYGGQVQDRITTLQETGHIVFETVHRAKDGTRIPTEVSGRVITYHGKPAIISTGRDITERKLAEDALRESEAKYRHILENMQDAYFRAGLDGNLALVNPSAARIFGYGFPEEMSGVPVASLYRDPAERGRLLGLLEKHARVDDFTGEARRKDGSLFWASISIHYLLDRDGRPVGTEAIVRDITGRKTMEHAIQEANRKLNLLNTITRHDVANQLTALKGYVQLAERKKPDPAVEDFLRKIGDTADTIERQIAFTRVYQELGIQAPAWFTIEETARKAAGTSVPLQFSGTCHAVSILADPMLERVFFNLFENAAHHGKRVTRIAVRCEREPDGVLVIVEDDGVGIKPHEKEKIFTKGYGKNTGFGLFLAREILAITGITIRETGTFGKGARFEMLVPRGACRLPEAKGHHG